MVKDTNREWMLEALTEERVERGLPEKLPEPEKATEGRQSASLNNPSQMWGLAIVSLLLMGGTTALVLKALWLQRTGGPEGSLLPNALCSAGAGVAGLLLSGFAPDDMTSPLGFFAGMDLIVCMVALLFSLRTRR